MRLTWGNTHGSFPTVPFSLCSLPSLSLISLVFCFTSCYHAIFRSHLNMLQYENLLWASYLHRISINRTRLWPGVTPPPRPSPSLTYPSSSPSFSLFSPSFPFLNPSFSLSIPLLLLSSPPSFSSLHPPPSRSSLPSSGKILWEPTGRRGSCGRAGVRIMLSIEVRGGER